MEKINNYYESLFIADVTGGEEALKATVAKFVGLIENNAERVIEVNEWGKRRLAYPINDKPEGYYVVVTFQGKPEFPAEFERLCHIDENILRSLVIRLDFEPVAKVAEPVSEPVAEPASEEVAPAVAEDATAADAE